ncbi:hypothetical protein DB88DRAFT_479165 [Papiliotrema laurentii]|uniref:Uncharacterized protein n=1 Tax=Papiliotrema laurentii TaxID=5418 RepID=A0AAD9FXD4_PAPLA|nr:hypothetical protein DB88DRAFT_479165 [Papiliotrema laurentii]
MSTIIPVRIGLMSRLWTRYLTALEVHPIRTKMITSGSLYICGDFVAQFGIEGRTLRRTEDDREQYDPMRTLRLTTYGGLIFAPLAHYWLSTLQRLKLRSNIATLGARLVIDSFMWSPFVCALFPSSLGLLEGKSVPEVKRKVQYGWFATWQKAVAVFGPTQIINLTLVPPQHRLLLLQSVGLGWNIFLSYQNNRNNKLLAAANDELLHAHTVQEEAAAIHKIEKLEKKRRDLREGEGGGAQGVATRMSWS